MAITIQKLELWDSKLIVRYADAKGHSHVDFLEDLMMNCAKGAHGLTNEDSLEVRKCVEFNTRTFRQGWERR